jgi:hypothetical protein
MHKKSKAFDVIVVGGGIAGVVSAVAAARLGVSVMLIEKGSCLGGSATAGMLGEINGAYLNGQSAVPDIGQEIIEKLNAIGAGVFRGLVPMTSNPDIKVDRVRYHSEYLKLILDEMVVENGVETVFCATLHHVNELPDGVEVGIRNIFEEITVKGRILIDSTGNSECFYLAGGETVSSLKSDKQAVSIIFKLGGINIDAFETLSIDEIQSIIQRGNDAGILPGRILSMLRVPGTRDITINCTRCSNIDHEDIEDVSGALIEIRNQIKHIVPFIKAHVKGCQDAYLSTIASSLGVRDRRRIVGEQEIKYDDIINCTRYEDSVAIGVYPIDIHKNGARTSVEFKPIQGNGIYKIPYGSLLHQTLDRIIANGKCISADDIAFGAFRAMGPIMNIAVASGTAAAIAARENVTLKAIDIKALQKQLRTEGVKDI